jgi:hypothetical protein
MGSKIAFEVEFSLPRSSLQNAMRFTRYLLCFRLYVCIVWLLINSQLMCASNSFKVQLVIENL